ncbi:uncharacterized protein [Littorina saxatilis]|uniref:uncharacterized protein n=1 Tax=Littorina saxatilis TaxID=31220 RepID=UPI0038B42811
MHTERTLEAGSRRARSSENWSEVDCNSRPPSSDHWMTHNHSTNLLACGNQHSATRTRHSKSEHRPRPSPRSATGDWGPCPAKRAPKVTVPKVSADIDGTKKQADAYHRFQVGDAFSTCQPNTSVVPHTAYQQHQDKHLGPSNDVDFNQRSHKSFLHLTAPVPSDQSHVLYSTFSETYRKLTLPCALPSPLSAQHTERSGASQDSTSHDGVLALLGAVTSYAQGSIGPVNSRQGAKGTQESDSNRSLPQTAERAAPCVFTSGIVVGNHVVPLALVHPMWLPTAQVVAMSCVSPVESCLLTGLSTSQGAVTNGANSRAEMAAAEKPKSSSGTQLVSRSMEWDCERSVALPLTLKSLAMEKSLLHIKESSDQSGGVTSLVNITQDSRETSKKYDPEEKTLKRIFAATQTGNYLPLDHLSNETASLPADFPDTSHSKDANGDLTLRDINITPRILIQHSHQERSVASTLEPNASVALKMELCNSTGPELEMSEARETAFNTFSSYAETDESSMRRSTVSSVQTSISAGQKCATNVVHMTSNSFTLTKETLDQTDSRWTDESQVVDNTITKDSTTENEAENRFGGDRSSSMTTGHDSHNNGQSLYQRHILDNGESQAPCIQDIKTTVTSGDEDQHREFSISETKGAVTTAPNSPATGQQGDNTSTFCHQDRNMTRLEAKGSATPCPSNVATDISNSLDIYQVEDVTDELVSRNDRSHELKRSENRLISHREMNQGIQNTSKHNSGMIGDGEDKQPSSRTNTAGRDAHEAHLPHRQDNLAQHENEMSERKGTNRMSEQRNENSSPKEDCKLHGEGKMPRRREESRDEHQAGETSGSGSYSSSWISTVAAWLLAQHDSHQSPFTVFHHNPTVVLNSVNPCGNASLFNPLLVAADPSTEAVRSPLADVTNKPTGGGSSGTAAGTRTRKSTGRKKEKAASTSSTYETEGELASSRHQAAGSSKVSFCRDARQDAMLFYPPCAKTAAGEGSSFPLTLGGPGSETSSHRCPHCSLEFSTPADLHFHQSVHERNTSGTQAGGGNNGDRESTDRDNGFGDTRNKCAVCSRVFTRSWLLKGHMRTHTGERPFRCTWPQCQRAFADKSNLRSHTLIHTTTAKSFSCPKCSRAFSQKRYLHKHMLEVCRII